MGINADQLRLNVIRPVLKTLNLWTQSAENLLLGTAAQESRLGTYLKQINGPALGIYQMEPATYVDIRKNYLNFKDDLRAKVDEILPYQNVKLPDALIANLAYATAMARVHYRRVAAPLPDSDDVNGLAMYWKDHYNTAGGAGSVDEFVVNYQRLVLNKGD